MFPNFKIYLIFIGIIALLLIGFYFYHKSTRAEIDLLKANEAKYELSINLQKQTITKLEEKANKLAETNIQLSTDLAMSEQSLNVDISKILNLQDTETLTLEKQINDLQDSFNQSIIVITSPTKRLPEHKGS